MMDLRTNLFWRRLLRGVAAAAALSLMFASVGVTWTVGPRKDRSVAFPCMDRACGCQNAASCKEHCCCFSDAEKLVWAAEHHVDPAPFVSDCAVELVARAAPRSCCSTTGHRGPRLASAATAMRRAAGRQHVTVRILSIAAQRQCHGLAQLWSVLAAALPPNGPRGYEFDWICTGTIAQFSPLPIIQDVSPPVPPPRG